MGSVSGMARHAQDVGRPLFVLWLDAHADFNSPATSPSGNMHGMPVAFFCGEAEFAPILPKDRPLVDPKKVYQVGIRSVDAREREEIAEHGVNVFDMRAIDEMGMAHIIRQIVDEVRAANGLLHVSLDVDFMDPELAPGVGTTVPGGATFARRTSSWKCCATAASSLPSMSSSSTRSSTTGARARAFWSN